MSLNDIKKPTTADEELFLTSMTDTIGHYHNSLRKIESQYKRIGCEKLSFPCYFNFRDALFHYDKAYTAQEVTALHCEQYAMHEHLHRAVKDGCIGFLQIVNRRLDVLYQYKFDSARIEELTKAASKIAVRVGKSMSDIQRNDDFAELNTVLRKDRVSAVDYNVIFEYVFCARFGDDTAEFKKEGQQIFHELRNLELEYRSRSMQIVRPFANESDRSDKPTPFDTFWEQCNAQIDAIENSRFFDYFMSAALLDEISAQSASG